MARIEVVMPQMGESVTEGTIVKWHKQEGERVTKDETLLEITTDKVDSEISSPATGVLFEIIAGENTTVPVRGTIAIIEQSNELQAEPTAAAATVDGQERKPAPHAVSWQPQSIEPRDELQSEPAAARIITKEQNAAPHAVSWQPQPIEPPVEARRAPIARPATTPEAPASATTPTDLDELRRKYPPPLHDVIPMTQMMQRMAAHMVKSVSTSPHVAAHHEADLTAVVAHRAAHRTAFEESEGFKLTYTPYIIEAVVKALQKYPLVNSSVEGTAIIRKNFINLGIAVATENGLIVPVIHHAEDKNILGLARAVNDIAARARKKKLTPEDVHGGTFTITNYGVFGTTIGTPIINQPQVAILGTGTITPRITVVNNAMAIRSLAWFTLSFDHRIIDGELGGRFVEEVIRHLQRFDANVPF